MTGAAGRSRAAAGAVLPALTAAGIRIRLAAGTAAIGIAACLLGAGCVVWAAVPQVHKGLADFALFLAIFGVAAGALRLALAGVPVPEDSYLLSLPLRAWLRFLETLRLVPWEEGALITVLWLEVLHPSRPWHTAILGAALITYFAWPRARYFGNTAPLLVATLFLVVALGTPHYPGLGFQFMAVPFLFVFVAGIAADLLETRHRAIALASVWGLLVANAGWNLWELARVGRG